jgi:hypothetical protein
MFGKHWKAAQGTVVDLRTTHTTQDGFISNHEFVVDVTTPEGEAFRARVPEPRIATFFMTPRVGQAVAVQYDARSHDVRFDKSDPGLRRPKSPRSKASDFNEVLSQPPGTPVGPSTQMRNVDPLVQRYLDQALQARNQDPNSPEAAALREAMTRAMGSQPGYPGYPGDPGAARGQAEPPTR